MKLKLIVLDVLSVILIYTICLPVSGWTDVNETPDFNVIAGEWVRPDGGYVVHVKNIKPDGEVDVEYLNPSRINVAEAKVSIWKGLVKLFVKLEDEGYPGSTYTLYYYTEKDAFAGYYYQATMKKTYKVVFFRKSIK